MPYVSCRYGPPPDPISQQMIICVDEEGNEWWVPENSDNGAFLYFTANGGTIDPYAPPKPLDEPGA